MNLCGRNAGIVVSIWDKFISGVNTACEVPLQDDLRDFREALASVIEPAWAPLHDRAFLSLDLEDR